MNQAIEIFARAAKRGIPDGLLNLVSWASRNRHLSAEDSAKPGLYDPTVTPYMIEPQNCVSDPRVNEVILMTSAQVAKTTVLLNALGYYSDAEPSPILFLMPTEDLCKLFAKKRLRTMVRDSPTLKACYLPESQQEILEWSFAGGFVSLTGTNSPVKLSSQPIRIVLGDELDRMERDVKGEGSPVVLARKRTTTFRNRKIVWCSTPTKKGDSPIEDLYLKSDMRKYWVPCPFCNGLQLLLFKNVKWEPEAPQDAWFVCEHCAERIDDEWRKQMIDNGVWKAEKPFQGRAGFWINQWYSPFVTIGETVMEFLDNKDKKETLKTIVNTVFAETFDDSEQPDITGIEDQREVYLAEVPNGVLILTAGVDVQGDRLEVEIIGWGIGEESWSIDYHIIMGEKDIIGEDGEPTTRKLTPNDPELWDRLKTVLTKAYAHENGYNIFVSAVGMDTGGHHTKKVYEQAKRNRGRRWLAMKGAKDAGRPLLARPTKSNKARIPLYVIGTEAAKDAIYGYLQVKEQGPGYCHFPEHYEPEYFKQLTSEKRVTKFEKGKSEVRYIKIRERNESLDCRVYGAAALAWMEPDWMKLQEDHNAKAVEITGYLQEQAEDDLPNDVGSSEASHEDHIESEPVPIPSDISERVDAFVNGDDDDDEMFGPARRQRTFTSGRKKWN
jgi:phage terminase large subunit GpA-like protein